VDSNFCNYINLQYVAINMYFEYHSFGFNQMTKDEINSLPNGIVEFGERYFIYLNLLFTKVDVLLNSNICINNHANYN